jgi:CRISPR-associated endonuclease/helicase Cas3
MTFILPRTPLLWPPARPTTDPTLDNEVLARAHTEMSAQPGMVAFMKELTGRSPFPFDEFFSAATGHAPYGFQERLARVGLPPVVQAPTGCGKTGVVLAWLWRWLYGPEPAATPRRLVYALPQRSLVEQVAGEAARWLDNLDLADDVALHVVMGGEGASQRQWRVDMHRPAILVGTVDSLVSKALNRGYGIGRSIYPIDFALVTNGAHWVIDEVQLCPESTTTLRQLAAFAGALGTAEPFGLTCMSATVAESLLDTVDNPAPGPAGMLQIEQAERTGELALRLGARRTVRRLIAKHGDTCEVAATARGSHRPGTVTLVVMNTVRAAQAVYQHLRGGSVPCTLLHSRFRGQEREQLVNKVAAPPGEQGHIVVATQVVEAGIDLNAAVLIAEAAPWPCVVQRAGRCNRTGTVDGAVLYWATPATHYPYPEPDVVAAIAELEGLEGKAVTGEDLLARQVPTTEPAVAVLRWPDLVGLFDTAPDLSGADLDVAPYVRDGDDLDVQLAWATWEPDPGAKGAPPAGAKAPEAQWRCRVPLRELETLMKRDVAVWRLDQALGRWTRVSRRQRARPGEVVLVAAGDGGYDLEIGFDAAAMVPISECPALAQEMDPATGTEDCYGEDSASVAQQRWVSLEQHSIETRAQARALVDVLEPSIGNAIADVAVAAAYAHDVGKCHKIWQDALCALAPSGRRAEIDDGGPWAKSGRAGRLRFAGDVPFRHELASLLMLDGPFAGLLAGVDDIDLARYLVLAHHGKLRVQVREPDDAEPGVLLGLEQHSTQSVPPLLGQHGGELTVDLDQFALGGERSWTRTALALRDRYGPFVLAYLETVVRVADWRASGGMEVPQ